MAEKLLTGIKVSKRPQNIAELDPDKGLPFLQFWQAVCEFQPWKLNMCKTATEK